MFDHYVINVAQMHGTDAFGARFRHIFATAPHSGRLSEPAASALLATMRARFPEAEGFKVDMTYWVARGTEVEA